MKRILWCETWDDGTVGGSHACMYNLATRLDRSRFEVIAAFCRPNLYSERFAAAGFETIMIPGHVDRGGGFGARVAAFLDRQLLPGRLGRVLDSRKINLLVLNNSVFAGAGFLDPCFERRVPVVAWERGLGPPTPERAPIVARTAQLAASIAISQAVRENMQRIGFRTPRIEIVYDGIDPAHTSTAAPQAVRAQLGIAAGDAVIGMIGNVRHWKGQHVFIEAFACVAKTRPNLRGLMVGGWGKGDMEYHARLTSRIAELGLTDRLRLLGYRSDVNDLLQAMDVVVHASVKPEPWGMVLLEAMAANRPVVATAMGGPLEILDQGHCGELVAPENAEAMGRSIARYLDDPAYRAETVARARARVESAFHIRETVARASALFDALT